MTVFFGAIATSKSPFLAVAVWARMSLLTHSMVSPTLADTSAGETARSLHHDLDGGRMRRDGSARRASATSA